ncbi:MAG: alpha/beta hydrolase family protein [Elusimicrobiota bacterium]
MNKVLTAIAFISVFLASSSAYSAQVDISTVTLYSDALGYNTTYYVYLPPNRQPGEKFPVLYILHGAWGYYGDWVDRTNVEDLADKYKMVLVFPDCSQFGWYLDSKIKSNSKYETYIIKELVPEVNKKFPVLTGKNKCGIMGLSMGGHGAMILTAHNPKVFGSASSLSGILQLEAHPTKLDSWHLREILGDPNDKSNKKQWSCYSVYAQAKVLKKNGVNLLFDCGVDDTKTGAITDARALHTKLDELKVKHTYNEYPGNHTWDYWQAHLEEHLKFHSTAMSGK